MQEIKVEYVSIDKIKPYQRKKQKALLRVIC